MEFGIGLFGDLAFNKETGAYKSAAQKYSEILTEIKLADEAGIDLVAVGEHHRADYSIANPELILSAIAAVTQRIKLASGVTVLSSSDPVKVFQDYATLDQLSKGRAEIIAGRGSFTESFPLFGYNLEDYDELFSEKLELLLQLNEEETITWKGKFRAPLQKQSIYPRPFEQRNLPVWLAVGGTPSSVHRAATLGLPMILAIIGGQPAQFKDYAAYYKRLFLDSGHPESQYQLGVHSHTFLAGSQKEITTDYFPAYAAQMDRVGRSRGWPPYSLRQFEAGISPNGALFMGEPRQVADKILQLHELLGITRFVAHMDVGDPGHLQMMKSIETFATKVIPEVKKGLPVATSH